MTPLPVKKGASTDETGANTHYVLGGAQIGTVIAEQLQNAGHRVTIVDESYESSNVRGFASDPADPGALVEAGIETASTVVVATRSDSRNFLIAQLARTRFDVPRVVAFVHDPDRLDAFAGAGHEPFCVTTALTEAAGEAI